MGHEIQFAKMSNYDHRSRQTSFFALLYTLQVYPGKCAEGKAHTFHMILHDEEDCGIYIKTRQVVITPIGTAFL